MQTNIVPVKILTCHVDDEMGSFKKVGGVHEAESPLPVPSLINEDQQRDESIEMNPTLGRAAYTDSAHWKHRDDVGPLVQRC